MLHVILYCVVSLNTMFILIFYLNFIVLYRLNLLLGNDEKSRFCVATDLVYHCVVFLIFSSHFVFTYYLIIIYFYHLPNIFIITLLPTALSVFDRVGLSFKLLIYTLCKMDKII